MGAHCSTVSSVSKSPQKRRLVLFLLALLLLAACAGGGKASESLDKLEGDETSEPGDAWSVLMARNAYPYTTPLPPVKETAIDGTYVKFDPKEATPIPCRRCPDYMNEGGIWKLSFDKGTFRILHLVTGWTGIGSYAIQGDQLILFNDPKCLSETGLYRWRHVDGGLVMETVLDHCAADMRSHNLEQMVWHNCAAKSKPLDNNNDHLLLQGC